jgi:hypothetical protein
MQISSLRSTTGITNLEPTDEHVYTYQVYIAHTEHDEEKASEISNYLKSKGIHSILKDEASGNAVGRTWGQQLLLAVRKCRWFVILLTRKALEDNWNANIFFAINNWNNSNLPFVNAFTQSRQGVER